MGNCTVTDNANIEPMVMKESKILRISQPTQTQSTPDNLYTVNLTRKSGMGMRYVEPPLIYQNKQHQPPVLAQSQYIPKTKRKDMSLPTIPEEDNVYSLSDHIAPIYSEPLRPLNTDVINRQTITKPDYNVQRWRNLIDTLVNNLGLMNFAHAPKHTFKSLGEFKKVIATIRGLTKLEVAWIVYAWICNNIEYDVDGYKTGFLVDISPEGIFRTGKTISWGYANLFSDICIYVGIKCISISGFAKGLTYRHKRGFVDTNHEWNAIEINNVWHLVDCTWGAGFINEEDKFERKFMPHYFMTPPQIFIYDHYSNGFQLQAQKMSLKRFEKMPLLKLQYFIADVECISHDIFTDLYPTETSFLMEFTCAEEYTISGNLEKTNGQRIENAVLVQYREVGAVFEFFLQLPVGEDCLFNLFTRSIEDEWAFSAEFFLHATPNISITKNMSKPVYALNTNLYLVKPIQWNLDLGKDINYELQVSDDTNVELVNKSQKILYHKDYQLTDDNDDGHGRNYENNEEEKFIEVVYDIESEAEPNDDTAETEAEASDDY